MKQQEALFVIPCQKKHGLHRAHVWQKLLKSEWICTLNKRRIRSLRKSFLWKEASQPSSVKGGAWDTESVGWNIPHNPGFLIPSNEVDQGPRDEDANGGSLLKKGKGTPEGGLGLVSWGKDRQSVESPVHNNCSLLCLYMGSVSHLLVVTSSRLGSFYALPGDWLLSCDSFF